MKKQPGHIFLRINVKSTPLSDLLIFLAKIAGDQNYLEIPSNVKWTLNFNMFEYLFAIFFFIILAI